MKTRSGSLIAMIVLPALAVGAGLWWLGGIVPDCRNGVTSTVPSPSASQAVVVFVRDCGADGRSTQAVIIPADGSLDGDASGFLALDGRHPLDVRWQSDDRLDVFLPPSTIILQQQAEVAGITVSYHSPDR